MKERTLEELDDRVKGEKQRRNKRQKKHYRLARTLGFSAAEATVLQNWAEDTIRQLAKERA